MRSRSFFPILFALVAGPSLPACSSAQTSIAGPTSDTKCQVVAGSSPASFAAGGGTGTISVSTSRDCTWTIATSTSWVSLGDNRSGQGEASIVFTVAANPIPSARSGTIVVANQTVELSQAAAPCRYSISRTRDSVGIGGGQLSVDVSTLTGCTWTATSSTRDSNPPTATRSATVSAGSNAKSRSPKRPICEACACPGSNFRPRASGIIRRVM